ncbi:MAG: hypothetical protein Kow0060_01670 [Methylohalobius crimeensis]
MLPQWAVRAIDSMEPTASEKQTVTESLTKNWAIIQAEFLPAIESLTDLGKQVMFDGVVYLALEWMESDAKKAREALTEQARLERQIIKKASELAKILDQHEQLQEAYGYLIPTNFPTFRECVRRSSSPAWWMVGGRDAFQQSRTGPRLADILEIIGETQPTDSSVLGKSRGIFYREAISVFENKYFHPEIPEGFRLSDKAIAGAIRAATGFEATEHNIKMARYRF